MSQRQQTQEQQKQQQTQVEKQQIYTAAATTTTACKNKKRKNRRKRSQNSSGSSGAPANKCDFNKLSLEETADCTEVKEISKLEKKPLHTSMEQLKVAAKTNTPVASRKAAGSNWEAAVKSTQPAKQKSNEQENVQAPEAQNALSKSAKHRLKRRAAEQRYVAMDCEMVGVGLNGQDDMLARVSIVNKRGEVLLDKFVKPQESVTDYRTSVSGIRPHDIDNGEDFKSVQEEVVQMLQGKILVGHAIRNDLSVLHIKHPNSNIRDTSRYKPLCRLVANGRTPSLKRLTQAILGKEIQTGEHNSVEDARAAMSIYNCLASDWEEYIKRHKHKANK